MTQHDVELDDRLRPRESDGCGPDWEGSWGDQPPFGSPVYVLTHTAPRPSLPMRGDTTLHLRSAAIEDVLAQATEAAGGQDVRVGGGVSTARDSSEVAESGTIHITFTR